MASRGATSAGRTRAWSLLAVVTVHAHIDHGDGHARDAGEDARDGFKGRRRFLAHKMNEDILCPVSARRWWALGSRQHGWQCGKALRSGRDAASRAQRRMQDRFKAADSSLTTASNERPVTMRTPIPVSYTHLTLPTICSV